MGDHAELDLTEFLNEDDTQKYQSLIGSMQSAISIGRFDIQTAVMTLSGFRCAPRLGHMECTHWVCGYHYKMRDATIQIRMDEPNYANLE